MSWTYKFIWEYYYCVSNHNWYLETTWSSVIVGIDNLQQFCVSSVTHKLIYQCNGFRIWQIQSFHDWWRVWVKNHLQVNQTLLLLLQRQWHKLLPHYCWRWRRSYEKIINPHFPSWQLKVSTWDVICHQNSSACHIRRLWSTLDVVEIGRGRWKFDIKRHRFFRIILLVLLCFFSTK